MGYPMGIAYHANGRLSILCGLIYPTGCGMGSPMKGSSSRDIPHGTLHTMPMGSSCLRISGVLVRLITRQRLTNSLPKLSLNLITLSPPETAG